jgi:hypothetical protein
LAVASVIGGATAIPALVSGQSPPAPTITTGKPDDIEAGSALVRGVVNPNGSATTYSFRYGATAEYGRHTAPTVLPASTAAVEVEARLSGLQPGVRYHYRLVAHNAFGTAEGEDATLVSAAPALDGRYRVRIRVVAGGRPFGQHRGDGGVRQYRFKPRCAPQVGSEGCAGVRFRRAAQRGKFSSLLKQMGTARWSGRESYHGHCDNGLEFRSRTRIGVHAEAVVGERVSRIAGQLDTVVRGCISGSERATFEGQLR